jgi:predicted MPP superfamily phosphohydrolase
LIATPARDLAYRVGQHARAAFLPHLTNDFSDRPLVRRKKRSLATIAFRACVALAVVAAVWALFIGPRWLVVNRVDLGLPGWPRSAAPLKVALLSDLHIGSPHWGVERVRELVERTNAEKADIVLLAGDYVIDDLPFGSKVDPESVAQVLSGLRAPFGVVAVLGNHDWWNDGPRLRRALEAKGIVVLENEVHSFVHSSASVAIAGLADQIAREPRPVPTFDHAPPNATLIALVHEPDVFPLLDQRAAITLAGHTHGGQVRLPLFGSLIVPSAYGQRYAGGHIVENGRHLFVTTGIGTSILPVRFSVPPELVILTLHAAGGAH